MTTAYEKFRESMQVGFGEWHDGFGYDLAALRELRGEERAEVEAELLAKLKTRPDWRDVEALAFLGTEQALEALVQLVKGEDYGLKLYAGHYLREYGNPEWLGMAIEDVLAFCREEDVVSRAIDYSFDLQSRRVENQLLFLARRASGRIRFEAAARLLNLGMADDAFWKERPFLMRFTAERDEEVEAVFKQLCGRLGIKA